MLRKYDILSGYYGFGNFGDDLFRDTLIAAMSRTSWANAQGAQDHAGHGAKFMRRWQAISNLSHSRSITLGGGSILGLRSGLEMRKIELATASFKKIPYCAIGVGLLEGLSQRPDAMISKMSWVGLRSEAEYLDLSKKFSNVYYTSDIAYACPQILSLTRKPHKDTGEICIIPAGVGELGMSSTDAKWTKDWLVANIVPLLNQASGVKLIRLQPSNDEDLAAVVRFERALGVIGVPYRTVIHSESVQTVYEISNSLFVFSDRLHGAILAHICGVPFRLSKHHKKCNEWLFDLAHPDANPGQSIIEATSYEAVRDWIIAQNSAVSRHSMLALEGISAWLDHLQSRVS